MKNSITVYLSLRIWIFDELKIFNKKELKKYLEDRNEEILELEIALNKANNEILIDID